MDKNKNKNKTLIPKIICLLLSFGLWIYVSNVENPVRTYEIKNVPVELINIDALENSNFAIPDNQEFTVDLKLEGSSTDLIKVKPEDFKIVADMSTYALKLGENMIPVQIVDYPNNINIQNNGFLGIKVNLEKLISKDLTIKSKVRLDFKDNIYELRKSITPETVTIKGAESTIGKVEYAIISGEEKDIAESFEKNYDIKLIDSKGNEMTGLYSNITNAKLSVEVSHGKSVPINLNITGTLKPGLELNKSELSSNYVNIIGNVNALSNISSIDTEPIDISNLESSTELDVKLIIPDGIIVKDGQNYIKVKITILSSEKTNEDNIISKTLEVPVKYSGLKDEFTLETLSNNVTVTISGSESEISNITEGSLNAMLNLSDILEEGSYSYKPEVQFINPSASTITDIGKVELVVKKKE